MAFTGTPKEMIIKAKVDLNQSKQFFSYILMNMNIESSESREDCPTMAVNRYGNLYWNDKFVESLSLPELTGVLCHEALHMATLTFDREGSRDHMLWNIATDLVINDMIIQEGLTLPKDVLLPDRNGNFTFKGKKGKQASIKIKGRTAEEVYEDLLNNAETVKSELCVVDGDGDGSGKPGSYKGQIDGHLKDDKKPGGGKTGQDKDGQSSKSANAEGWKKKAIEAATAAKSRGTLGAGLERILEGILEPEIDWRSKLYSFLTKDIPVDFSYRWPSKRSIATGYYMPCTVKENLEIVVACDISGSISYGSAESEGGKFIAEAVGIAQSFPQIKMRMLFWGTEIFPEDDIVVTRHNYNDLITHTPKGGGGTELSCVKEYAEKNSIKSRVWVILTDGYIENCPKLPEGNVLFVISKTGSKEIVSKYGDVTQLRSGD